MYTDDLRGKLTNPARRSRITKALRPTLDDLLAPYVVGSVVAYTDAGPVTVTLPDPVAAAYLALLARAVLGGES